MTFTDQELRSTDRAEPLLRRELRAMAAAIVQTRREIAAIKPNIEGENCVACASEELALVLSSTEKAAGDILNAAERLQQIGAELKAAGAKALLCDEIDTHAMNLMVACSFQDLTGQRMAKAGKTLRYIEDRINGLIEIWGVSDDDAPIAQERSAADVLLNGPAKDGEGVSQDDIDRMIAG
jgi:chemotaxis regulatin CheY-phosphate phosphatase CheZ